MAEQKDNPMKAGNLSVSRKTLFETLALSLLAMPWAASAQEARLEAGLGPSAKTLVVGLPSWDLDLGEPHPLQPSAPGVPVPGLIRSQLEGIQSREGYVPLVSFHLSFWYAESLFERSRTPTMEDMGGFWELQGIVSKWEGQGRVEVGDFATRRTPYLEGMYIWPQRDHPEELSGTLFIKRREGPHTWEWFRTGTGRMSETSLEMEWRISLADLSEGYPVFHREGFMGVDGQGPTVAPIIRSDSCRMLDLPQYLGVSTDLLPNRYMICLSRNAGQAKRYAFFEARQ